MLDPSLCLFKRFEGSDGGVYGIDPRCTVAHGDGALRYYEFFGRLLGKALFDRQLVHAPFCAALARRLVGRAEDDEGSDGSGDDEAEGGEGEKYYEKYLTKKKPDAAEKGKGGAASNPRSGDPPLMRELARQDPQLHNSLCWMLDNDITGVLDDETFTVLEEEFGAKKEVELVKGGARMRVTEKNKVAYVAAVARHRAGGGARVAAQTAALLAGWHELPVVILQRTFLD